MPNIYHIILRLFLSALLASLVGIERESVNRPAGLRTHILVCVGSCLIMLSGLYLFFHFKSSTNIDPARLAAQVISGIGFLGAGTIIKEGTTVKGLTTAASLWTVAGIGIAIGCGFYIGAIIATILVLIALIAFSKIQRYVTYRCRNEIIKINTIDKPGQLGIIGTELGKLNISIKNLKMEPINDRHLHITLYIVIPRNVSSTVLIENLSKIEGISSTELLV